ncbi:MAG: c-type cytochrome biogenesis protein CcmI [Pseudomonadota bacterium]
MFWILASALTIIALLVAFMPIIRPRASARDVSTADSEFDTAVYQDQLSELDADRARGSIDSIEYEQARIEVARRIIAVENRQDAAATKPVTPKNKTIGPAFALLFVPAITLLFYFETGSPELDAQPLSARLEQAVPGDISDEIAAMLERAEEHLQVNPNDVRGWDVVAPVYVQIGRYDKAVTAYNNAIALDGATARRLSGLGEALVSGNGGIIAGEALTRFQAAQQLDATDRRARFFVALAAAQSGNLAEAERGWQALVADGEQERWTAMAQEALSRLSTSPAPGAAPQLDEQQRDAVTQLPHDERNEMILSMVEGLDARLQADPNDLDGWLRLIRARVVLGQVELAKAALSGGNKAFANDVEAQRSFRSLAEELNIPLEEEGS